MPDPFKALATALAADGIRCQFHSAGQMVISRQVGAVWPNRGNSFSVTNIAGQWYLFTWVPIGYRVPDTSECAALCRTCMSLGDSAMGRVPSEIMREFGLVELSDEEAEAVFHEMDTRPGRRPE